MIFFGQKINTHALPGKVVWVFLYVSGWDLMVDRKASKLVIDEEEDDDWDNWEEEEEDEIIDDEDDEDEGSEKSKDRSSSKKRSRSKGNTVKRTRKPGGFREAMEHPGLKWSVRIFITLLVVFLLFAPLEPLRNLREATGIDSLKNLMRPYRTFPERVDVTMEVSFDLSVKYGAADEIDIQVASPFDIPLEPDSGNRTFIVQDVKNIVMTPDPTRPLQDFNKEYNFISGWNYYNVVPSNYQFKSIYEVTLYTHEWKLTEDDSGTVDDIPQAYKDKYLGDDWPVFFNGVQRDQDQDGKPDLYRYHPSDPMISSIAESLTRNEETVLGKVRVIYEWIVDHFNYTNPEQRIRDSNLYFDLPKWPTACIADWYGDCDDQSLLMASLCRSVGIPAWLEIGYLYDQVKDEWGGHGWFNVVIPLKNSETPFVVAPIDPVNSEFLFRDPFRITDWIDNGSYIVNDEGKTLYNLDDYYNFFSLKRPSFVDVDIISSFRSVNYEEHGSIKKYVDQKVESGNLQGTEQGIPELPSLNPLLVLPVLFIFIAIPTRRLFLKRGS